MNTAAPVAHERVLVVGRSPNVLLDTVELLRGQGLLADATNQFDSVLDDYDVNRLGILVFGGMVPQDTKKYLQEQVGARNPDVTFIQGLAGIPGLIAAQVMGAVEGNLNEVDHSVSYDTELRVLRVKLDESAHVTIDAYWATSFTPPEPKSTSMRVLASEFAAGSHVLPLPAQIPLEASFVTVTVATSVYAFTAGPMPQAVTGIARSLQGGNPLPPVDPVSTHSPD